MTNHEQTGATATRHSEVVCREKSYSDSKEEGSLSESKNLAKEMESKTKEYIEGLIEGRKKNNAFNNQSVQDTLVAASKRRRKRHGKIIDLSDID